MTEQDNQEPSEDRPKKPVKVYHSQISAWRIKVFEEETEYGTRQNFSLERPYQDDDGEWERTKNFGPRDLAHIQKLLERVDEEYADVEVEIPGDERQ